jgi:glycosyltransferase involved in cell wall biosynthesis
LGVNTTPGARPSISVALCTHNGERFITEQVRSILAQSYPPAELVLSDDASSDRTVAVATAIVEEHNRDHGDVRLVVMENRPALGVAANFAQAIAACTGDLVALSDQDDRWAPERLERGRAWRFSTRTRAASTRTGRS